MDIEREKTKQTFVKTSIYKNKLKDIDELKEEHWNMDQADLLVFLLMIFLEMNVIE